MLRPLALILVVPWLMGACSQEVGVQAPGLEVGEPQTQAAQPPEAHAEEQSPPAASFEALAPGQVRSIPAGSVRVGVRPGLVGRRPASEADLVEVPIPGFDIDRLPFPNDPTEPPTATSSRAAAAEMCQANGRRLCHELEWERACKGDGVPVYPGGDTFDAELCTLDPAQCASPHSVVGLGVFGYEWTASDVSRNLGSEAYSAVVRGAPTAAAASEHRCGARRAVSPEETSESVTFRCCGGVLPEISYPEEEELRSFRVMTDVDNNRLAEILRTIPELSAYADNFRRFTMSDIDRVLGRGDKTREDVTWRLLDGVLRWTPMTGELAWVFAGTGGGSSFVAVIHPLPDGSFTHGASFILSGEQTSIALAWEYGSPQEILWSSCWECAGDGGSVMVREEDDRIVVAQR